MTATPVNRAIEARTAVTAVKNASVTAAWRIPRKGVVVSKSGSSMPSSGDEKKKDRDASCRTGCKTKDHSSYAECLRSADFQIGNLK